LYAYTIELRPAEGEVWGGEGFILPPDQVSFDFRLCIMYRLMLILCFFQKIIPTGEEIFEAMKYFIGFAIEHPLKVEKS
jgi:hypothetical protein